MDCFATGGYILALILGRALNWLHSTPDQINDLLANELALTTVALKDHPKVYWLWNHRRWCLQNIPDGPLVDGQPSRKWMTTSWDKELAVVENMLNTDPRNCQHCSISCIDLSNVRTSAKSSPGATGDMFWRACLCCGKMLQSWRIQPVK